MISPAPADLGRGRQGGGSFSLLFHSLWSSACCTYHQQGEKAKQNLQGFPGKIENMRFPEGRPGLEEQIIFVQF